MNKGFWFEIVVPKMDPCIGVAQMCDATIVAIKTKSWAKKKAKLCTINLMYTFSG